MRLLLLITLSVAVFGQNPFSRNAGSIQGVRVCTTAPGSNQALVYNGSTYCPADVGGGTGGGGTVNSGTANQLGYYASTGAAVSGLTSGNNGVLVTNGSGVPSISSTLPSGVTLVAPVLGTPASGTLTNATGLPVSTGVSGLGSGVATFLGTPSSANLAAAVTNETGSGALVFATSPALVTPDLGTPSAGTLTNATGLPVSTGVSGLGTGVATFLGTPTSANLAAAVTNETGSGALVFATSPALVTPDLGTPSAGVLTNATGLPISTGVSGLGTGVATVLATPSSANLRSAVTDETGTGVLVFATDPTFTLTDVTTNNATTSQHGWLPKLGGGTTNFLRADGSWAAPGGSGTVTVVSSGNLTSTALVTGGGSQAAQTPSATSTLDSSGNMALAGTLTVTGAMSSGATPPTAPSGGTGGVFAIGEGTAPSANCVAASVSCIYSDSTAHALKASFNADTASQLARYADKLSVFAATTSAELAGVLSDEQGSGGGFVRATSPTLTTPALGVATATSINGLAITTSTGTLTIANGKTATVNNSLTLAGTDSTTMTFPTTSATLARTDAANTFTGTQTIGALVATTVNGNTFTTGTGVLTIAAAKTLTASNTLTLTGTDGSSAAFGAGGTVTYTIASGTKALDTDAIASTACDTLATTTATNIASTDTIIITPNADITGVTGYTAATTGGLQIFYWPTTNTINWKVCNPTSSSVTPGAVTLNYRVVR